MGKITLSPDELVTITQAATRLPSLLDGLASGRWFIQRHSRIEGVLISLDEYQRLTELEEALDHVMLARLVEERERARPDEYQDLDQVMQELGLEAQ